MTHDNDTERPTSGKANPIDQDTARLADVASAQTADAAELLQVAGGAAVAAGDEHPGASPRSWELRARATQSAVLAGGTCQRV
jgi:hypothetical protein